MRGDDYPVSSGAHVARPNIERMGWRSPIGRAVSPQFSLPESSWGCAPCWYRARLWRFAALSEQIGQPFSSFKVRNRLWPVENDRQEQVAAKLGVRRFYIPPMTMMLSWMGHPCFCGSAGANWIIICGDSSPFAALRVRMTICFGLHQFRKSSKAPFFKTGL